MVFRATNRQIGRHVAVTPENSTNRHLSYGRIILNRSISSASFGTDNRETGLTCLSGEGFVRAAGRSFDLRKYDSIYIPRDTQVEVTTSCEIDLAEFSADVENAAC